MLHLLHPYTNPSTQTLSPSSCNKLTSQKTWKLLNVSNPNFPTLHLKQTLNWKTFSFSLSQRRTYISPLSRASLILVYHFYCYLSLKLGYGNDYLSLLNPQKFPLCILTLSLQPMNMPTPSKHHLYLSLTCLNLCSFYQRITQKNNL